MNLDNALRVYALLNLAISHENDIPRSVATEQQALELIEARAIVEEHLLSLGWRNAPEDVPAMNAAADWARSKVA